MCSGCGALWSGHFGTIRAACACDCGTVWRCHWGEDDPVATLVVHSAKLLRELAWRPDPLRLAEAYFSGEIDVEGDLYALLAQHTHVQSLTLRRRDRPCSALCRPTFQRQLRVRAARHSISAVDDGPCRRPYQVRVRRPATANAIAFHYDVSNEFYRLWLDDQMVYSCAYFNDPGDTLEQAQRNKLDHICRKLRLKAGSVCWISDAAGGP